jgi:hypothetical protein
MSDAEPRDVARLREALRSLEVDGGPPVDAGRIFDAVHGNLAPHAREAIVEALLDSPDAAEAWRLARELAPEPDAFAPAPGGSSLWRWAPIAAALLVAVGLGWQVVAPWGEVATPVYRNTGDPQIASALEHDAALPRANPVLKWTAIEGARYRVRVLTTDLDPIEEAEDVTDARFTLSEEVVARLPAGTRVLWQVEARLPDGTTVVSPTFGARLQ